VQSPPGDVDGVVENMNWIGVSALGKGVTQHSSVFGKNWAYLQGQSGSIPASPSGNGVWSSVPQATKTDNETHKPIILKHLVMVLYLHDLFNFHIYI